MVSDREEPRTECAAEQHRYQPNPRGEPYSVGQLQIPPPVSLPISAPHCSWR
jgi:hypothetical protein